MHRRRVVPSLLLVEALLVVVLQQCDHLLWIRTAFAAVDVDMVSRANGDSRDYYCRSLNVIDDETVTVTQPDLTADLIVIGSGPGGTGLLHKLLQKTSTMTVLWIEKGPDRKVSNWPEDLILDTGESKILTPIQRRKMTWMQGFAWNVFGGGDAGNSGGPNYLGLVEDEVYEDEVFNLRNNSITPMTTTTERWTQAFTDSGFEFIHNNGPLRRRDRRNQVGQVSTIRTRDGRDRRVIAETVRTNPQVLFVRARAYSIIHQNGTAVGVRGVRIYDDDDNNDDDDHHERNPCVYWKANHAVVLAAGVFHSFHLLIESGIGSQPDLLTRQVPLDWWIVQETIGTHVGEELAVVYLSIEPEPQDLLGAEPRLVAQTTSGTFLAFWSTGLYEWTLLKDQTIEQLMKSFWFPNWLLKPFFNQIGFWGVGVPFGSDLKLVALPPNTDPNVLAIEIDDSKVAINEVICAAVHDSLVPLARGADLQRQAGGRSIWTDLAFWLFQWSIGILLLPTVFTKENIDEYISSDPIPKCRLEMFGQYHHYYGGTAKAIDESFRILPGLFIADASAIASAGPGGLASTTMELGMQVADAVLATWIE